MYPGSTQVEASRPYNQNQRHATYANDHTQVHAYHRPPIELPRPLEPRPTLHTSLSDSSGLQRRQEAFRSPLSPQYRSHGQNLPALREILSPGPEPSRRQSYGSIWNTNSGPPISHQSAEGHYAQSGMHPPMALYPPPEHSGRYQPHQPRQFDVAVLDTTPVANSLPQSLPMSPYAGYRDGGRDYSDVPADRPGPLSGGSSMINGYTSPYGPSAADDAQYRSPMGTTDRAHAAYMPSSAENAKRYLGVKDVPGEGRFHVYEDGHRLPTHVDGEQVNPQWGLTKANKPRKRLALACLDCREKKIKCEPGTKSCVQCEKANRACRRYASLYPPYATANFNVGLRHKSLNPIPRHLNHGQVPLARQSGQVLRRLILLRPRIATPSQTRLTNVDHATTLHPQMCQARSIGRLRLLL